MRFRLFTHLVAATVLVTAATVARSNAVAPSNNETSVFDFSFTSIDGKPIAVPETTTPLEAQTVAPAASANDVFSQGLAAANTQQYELALEYFTAAQKAHPNNSEIWFNLWFAPSKIP